MNNDFDYLVEKRYHPENFQEDTREDAFDIIDVIEDGVDDLSKYSVYHDDCLSSEVIEMYELIKRARRQLK